MAVLLEKTAEFNTWLMHLKDKSAKARILLRIRSAEHGNLGDCEPVGDGVSEMRAHWPRLSGVFHPPGRGGVSALTKETNPRVLFTSAMPKRWRERCPRRITHDPSYPFDAADYLDDEETIALYLNAALEDPNPDVLLAAIRDVARARGMTQLANAAGLGRESLYVAALTPGAKPRYDTVLKLLHALGVRLTATPVRHP